jgi:hypothetical protein
MLSLLLLFLLLLLDLSHNWGNLLLNDLNYFLLLLFLLVNLWLDLLLQGSLLSLGMVLRRVDWMLFRSLGLLGLDEGDDLFFLGILNAVIL